VDECKPLVSGTVCRNDTSSNASIAAGKLTCSIDVDHFSLYTLAEVNPSLRATSCASGSETCEDGRGLHSSTF